MGKFLQTLKIQSIFPVLNLYPDFKKKKKKTLALKEGRSLNSLPCLLNNQLAYLLVSTTTYFLTYL